MEAIEFDGFNIRLGVGQEEYNTLPAFKASTGETVTCWELSNEDFERLVETRKIYVLQHTFNKPFHPMYVTSDLNELLTFPDGN